VAIPLDPITRRKLVLVRQLHSQALVNAGAEANVVRRLLGVVILDLTVETMLKTVIVSLDTSKIPSDTFSGLVNQADQLLTQHLLGSLPDRVNISNVHTIRNDAQHKARYPSEVETLDCRTYVKDFLEKIAMHVWGISFHTLLLSDLIQNAEVKRYLFEAEKALDFGHYNAAVEQASAGLSWATLKVRQATVGSEPVFFDGFVMSKSHNEYKADQDTLRAFTRIQETLSYLVLGLDYGDYMRFTSVAGHTFFTIDGMPHTNGQTENLNQAEAEWAVSYALSAVIQVEATVGDIDRPFGREHWF